MARITINLPESFPFRTRIPVRITDLNYGGHVGNDRILSLIHEARVQFLAHYGFTEMNLGGTGLIMSDVGIVFKSELFYGDVVEIAVGVTELTRVSFEMVYLLEKRVKEKVEIVAQAKTQMVCYDYERKKISALPEEAGKFLG